MLDKKMQQRDRKKNKTTNMNTQSRREGETD